MKKASNIVLILIMLAGLSLLLYPSFANWWNSLKQNQAISDYTAALEEMEPADYTKMFEDAAAFNEELRKLKFPLMDYDEVPGYYDQLNITGKGIIAYIKIPKINVELPIYHGTSEGVLQVAVGHLEGTSLPVGGESTHCVFSAHRGLPSAKLFSDLDEMDVGDTFYVTVADQTLTYQVDQILVVLPTEVEPLYVQEGLDLCTLVTCTPYGINSHRLLVRGHRVDGRAINAGRVVADAVQIEPLVVACVLAVPCMLLGILLMMNADRFTPKNQKPKKQN